MNIEELLKSGYDSEVEEVEEVEERDNLGWLLISNSWVLITR